MAGNKNSGRKSNANEEFRLRTIDKCWKLIDQNIDNLEIPLETRLELASKHTVKSIPTEVSGDVGNTQNIVMMGEIKRGGDPLRFNIGDSVDASQG